MAVVWGCASSLRTTPSPPDAFNVVQNHGWQVIRPDLWVGMDAPAMFGGNSAGEWPKVYRHAYTELPSGLPDGRKARDIDMAFFPDLMVGSRASDDFFPTSGIDQRFMIGPALNKQQTGISTMHIAIQLALWMGFKRLGFAGIDLEKATDYAFPEHSRKWTLAQVRKVNQLLQEEYRWFKWFTPAAEKRGVTCVCLSPSSRLANLMEVVKCQG